MALIKAADQITQVERASRPGSGGSDIRSCGLQTGACLLTPKGYRPVETLRPGDLVGALIGRGPIFVPITFIGRRAPRTACSEPGLSDAPVRIRRNAIAERMPSRDLLLAPEHALYLEGRLYLVRQLINNKSILVDRAVRKPEYWGVQLERHDVVLAENLAVESLLPAHAAAFAPVRSPHLRVVGSEQSGQAQTTPEHAVTEFPASILMSARWFRRRLLNRVAEVPSAAEAKAPEPGGVLDIDAEIRAVAYSFATICAQRHIQLLLAIEPGLRVRMHRQRLHELLGAMLTHAIHGLGGGRILVGAMMHSGRVQIAVIDEETAADRESQQADLRQATEMAALQGASLELDMRPGEGSTLLLRLLAC